MKPSQIIVTVILLVVSCFVGIVIYVYVGLSKTTWGGWKPEMPEVVLSPSEKKWCETIEAKYNCKVSNVGYGDDFENMSIIYFDVTLSEKSQLLTTVCDSLEIITAKFAKSFAKASKPKRSENTLEFSFMGNTCQSSDSVPNSMYRKCQYYIPDGSTSIVTE